MRFFRQHHLIETGIDHTVRQYMLHPTTQTTQLRFILRGKQLTELGQLHKLSFRHISFGLDQRQFEQILPDVIPGTFIYIRVRACTYIYIIEKRSVVFVLCCFTGNWSTLPCASAAHVSHKGQYMHKGDCGVHCMAPKSMMA